MSEPVCRNCGAPLPNLGDGGIGACRSCGTLFGERAEIDEWASAVVAGRPDVTKPKLLETNRLKVNFEPMMESGYRRAGSGARLTITFRYFGPMALVSILLGSLAVGGLVWIWTLAVRASSFVVPAIASLPIAFYAWARVSTVFDRLLIRAADGAIFCQQSRSWPRIESKVAIDEVVQLFTAQTGKSYALFARLKDGKAKLMVRNMATPQLALYFERQLEHALGIADRSDEKELPKSSALPRPVSRLRMLAFELGLLTVFVAAPVVGLSACGSSLVELEVGDTPTEGTFELRKHAKVSFTSEIELTTPSWRYQSEIPRVVSFELRVLRDGRELQTLHCDPFEVFAWTTSSSNKRISSFWGPMTGCSTELDAGKYTLRAVRRWKAGAQRIGLDESIVAARD